MVDNVVYGFEHSDLGSSIVQVLIYSISHSDGIIVKGFEGVKGFGHFERSISSFRAEKISSNKIIFSAQEAHRYQFLITW